MKKVNYNLIFKTTVVQCAFTKTCLRLETKSRNQICTGIARGLSITKFGSLRLQGVIHILIKVQISQK